MTERASSTRTRLSLALTGAIVVVGGAGWFLLSWIVMGEPAGDAAGEALGVGFGMLIVVSVVGAVRGFARKSGDSGEDPEKTS